MAVELKSANEKLRHAAFHDSLTGLYNRQYFKEAIEREILRSDRYGHPLSLVLLDLDQFKTVNDTYGHHCGDVVLKTVGQMIVNGTRRSDIVVRYGGEEFAILLPETALANAVTKAEACRALIGATQMEADGHRVRLTISAGVATWNPAQPVTADELIKAADQALYLSKRQGRNRITVWDRDAATAPIHP
jgi:diguanylate cyclase (GGDEF)-like protein